MPALSTAQLAAMQAAVNATLPDTATITRRSTTSDGMGGQTVAWPTVATVACRVAVQRFHPREADIAERVTSVTHWTLTLPAGTDVQPTDRLIVSGVTYEVLAPASPGSYEVERRATCVIVV